MKSKVKDLIKLAEEIERKHQMLEYNLRQAQSGNYIVFSGELYSSKNSRRIFIQNNRPICIKSKASHAQEGDFEYQLGLQYQTWQKMLASAKKPYYPLKIKFDIYRKGKRHFDYLNIVQGLCDGLVKAGYLEDDSADHIIPHFEPYKLDRVNPRTLIHIMK